CIFFFSSRRRHTRFSRDWSSDVCSSDLTYRDEIRQFWRGEDGKIGALAGKVAGSAEIFNFAGRKPSHGVNLLAVHDGFTLRDLRSEERRVGKECRSRREAYA